MGVSTSVTPIESVEAWSGVIEIRSDLRVLAIQGTQRWSDSRDHLGITLHPLPCVIPGKCDCNTAGRDEHPLSPDSQVAEIVHVVVGDGVEQRAIALRPGEGQPCGGLLADRTGDRSLRLNESQVAVAEFEIRSLA